MKKTSNEKEYAYWSEKVNKKLNKIRGKYLPINYLFLEVGKIRDSLPKGLTTLTQEQKDELIKRCDDFLMNGGNN